MHLACVTSNFLTHYCPLVHHIDILSTQRAHNWYYRWFINTRIVKCTFHIIWGFEYGLSFHRRLNFQSIFVVSTNTHTISVPSKECERHTSILYTTNTFYFDPPSLRPIRKLLCIQPPNHTLFCTLQLLNRGKQASDYSTKSLIEAHAPLSIVLKDQILSFCLHIIGVGKCVAMRALSIPIEPPRLWTRWRQSGRQRVASPKSAAEKKTKGLTYVKMMSLMSLMWHHLIINGWGKWNIVTSLKCFHRFDS